ncbi:hypothetical protein YC2023_065522 [Brassica napus]
MVVLLKKWWLIDMRQRSERFDVCGEFCWWFSFDPAQIRMWLILCLECMFVWQGFIFMVCWVSFYRRNLDVLFTSHPFPRRVDLVMVSLVEFRRLRFLVLSFGGRGSSDKCGLGAEVEVTG